MVEKITGVAIAESTDPSVPVTYGPDGPIHTALIVFRGGHGEITNVEINGEDGLVQLRDAINETLELD